MIGAFEQSSTILHLRQNDPANKARNRPCSISRAEKKADWPKFFATFRKYTYPFFSVALRGHVNCSAPRPDYFDGHGKGNSTASRFVT